MPRYPHRRKRVLSAVRPQFVLPLLQMLLVSPYNTIMKLLFIGATGYTIWLMTRDEKIKRTYNKEQVGGHAVAHDCDPAAGEWELSSKRLLSPRTGLVPHPFPDRPRRRAGRPHVQPSLRARVGAHVPRGALDLLHLPGGGDHPPAAGEGGA